MATEPTVRKTIGFGKIDYLGNGRKSCAVDVEVTLESGRLSICGNIWNGIHTNIYSGGQNLDTIAQYVKSPKFNRIYEVWKTWHLNDMHAGTMAQEAIVNAWLAEGNRHDYNQACKLLAEHDMLYDRKVQGAPYRYGSSWLKRDLPQDVIDEVLSW